MLSRQSHNKKSDNANNSPHLDIISLSNRHPPTYVLSRRNTVYQHTHHGHCMLLVEWTCRRQCSSHHSKTQSQSQSMNSQHRQTHSSMCMSCQDYKRLSQYRIRHRYSFLTLVSVHTGSSQAHSPGRTHLPLPEQPPHKQALRGFALIPLITVALPMCTDTMIGAVEGAHKMVTRDASVSRIQSHPVGVQSPFPEQSFGHISRVEIY